MLWPHGAKGMQSASAAMGTFTRGDRYQVAAVAIEEKRCQQWFKNAFYIFFSKQHCASLAAVVPEGGVLLAAFKSRQKVLKMGKFTTLHKIR